MRCQRSTVSGRTITRCRRDGGQRRSSQTQRTRSIGLSRGVGFVRKPSQASATHSRGTAESRATKPWEGGVPNRTDYPAYAPTKGPAGEPPFFEFPIRPISRNPTALVVWVSRPPMRQNVMNSQMTMTPLPWRQELSPVTFLERAGTVHAERIAVIDEEVRYTWRQFRERSRRFASALANQGLSRGDRVAFLALNSEPLLLAHFAVPQAGGVLVAVNTRLSADEVATIVGHSGASRIFYSPDLAPSIAKIGGSVKSVALGGDLEELIETGSAEALGPHIDSEDELIALDYTSGTTGKPKGVMYHHRGAYLNALAMVIEDCLTRESTYLWTLPMFHCNGWSHTWALAAAGSTSVCIPRIDPAAVWDLLDEARVTHFNAAPTVLIMLANDPGAHRLERRVRVCTGGAPPGL